MKEIRWHGRGGQGAKTASQLLANINLKEGKHVQSFPEYGPERSGAPIKAYNRVSEGAIKIHSGVYDPEVVVVIDPTLLTAADPTEGLDETGTLLVNTSHDTTWVKGKTGFKGKVVAFNASKLAQQSGSGYANIPVLGALSNLLGTDLKTAEKEVKKALSKKLPQEIVKKNLEALRAGYEAIN